MRINNSNILLSMVLIGSACSCIFMMVLPFFQFQQYQPCGPQTFDVVDQDLYEQYHEQHYKQHHYHHEDKSSSGFDILQKKLYTKATSSSPDNNSNNKYKTKRKKFNLDSSWKRSSGGLNDQDRIALGNLFYNITSLFEFGLGESTYIAATTNSISRYAGVDSDALYVSTVRDNLHYEYNISHYQFYFADIGPTKEWGKPISSKKNIPLKSWYNYQIVPLASQHQPFDLYLIDGRFRVACVCMSFLHAMKYNGDMSSVVKVVIHDAIKRKKEYSVIRRIGRLVDMKGELKVYMLRGNVTEEDILDLWEDYAHVQL